MIEYLHNRIKDKNVLILGFGREGKSTLKALCEAGGMKSVGIADARDVDVQEQCDAVPDLHFHTGASYQSCMDSYDIVFKSPGIVLERDLHEYSCEIVSQMEIFFERFRDQIIGITGTKGKSTTTTLLYHILESAGRNVLLAGNIGIPVFDIAGRMTPDTTAVLELSCHQLEYMDVSPKVAVYLNLYEEHLDHYGTMEKYTHAKENIYRNQVEGDRLYCISSLNPAIGGAKDNVNRGDSGHGGTAACDCGGENVKHCGTTVIIGRHGTDTPGTSDYYIEGSTITYDGGAYNIPVDEIGLMGEHNYFDITFVYGVCHDLGLSDGEFTAGLKTYETLPHRLQFIGCVDGIKWYDDSISTIDETTIQALNTIRDADTVLIGGMDRGICYEALESYLSGSTVRHIILMEASGKRIADEIRRNLPDFMEPERLCEVEHLEDAVRLARQVTGKGRSVVLSPAAASYGIFKNFEERGEVYVRLVKADRV